MKPLEAIRCTYQSCTCECFSPGKVCLRYCHSCQHGWVAHALDTLGYHHAFNLTKQVEVVQPNIVFDIASLLLYGAQATPVRLKILLDRLFSVLQHEEVLQVLHGFGWSYEDYARGYILQDANGQVLDRWNMATREEETVILQQFLRFGETKTIAQGIILQESKECQEAYSKQTSNTESEIKRFIERNNVSMPSLFKFDISKTTFPPPHLPFIPSAMHASPMLAHSPFLPPRISINDSIPAAKSLELAPTQPLFSSTPLPTSLIRSFSILDSQQQAIADGSPVINLGRTDVSRNQLSTEKSNTAASFSENANDRKNCQTSLYCEKPSNLSLTSCMESACPIARKMSNQYSQSCSDNSDEKLTIEAIDYSMREQSDSREPRAAKRKTSMSITTTITTSPSLAAVVAARHLRKSNNPVKRQWIPSANFGTMFMGPNGKKRVLCTACNKTFCDKGALKIHYSAVHLKEMHKCSVVGCNMMFSSRRSRNRHSANPNPKLHIPQKRKDPEDETDDDGKLCTQIIPNMISVTGVDVASLLDDQANQRPLNDIHAESFNKISAHFANVHDQMNHRHRSAERRIKREKLENAIDMRDVIDGKEIREVEDTFDKSNHIDAEIKITTVLPGADVNMITENDINDQNTGDCRTCSRLSMTEKHIPCLSSRSSEHRCKSAKNENVSENTAMSFANGHHVPSPLYEMNKVYLESSDSISHLSARYFLSDDQRYATPRYKDLLDERASSADERSMTCGVFSHRNDTFTLHSAQEQQTGDVQVDCDSEDDDVSSDIALVINANNTDDVDSCGSVETDSSDKYKCRDDSAINCGNVNDNDLNHNTVSKNEEDTEERCSYDLRLSQLTDVNDSLPNMGSEVYLAKDDSRKCALCGKLFQNQFSVKIHFQNVHLKLMHGCTVEGCVAVFPSKRSRDRHSSNLNLHHKLIPCCKSSPDVTVEPTRPTNVITTLFNQAPSLNGSAVPTSTLMDTHNEAQCEEQLKSEALTLCRCDSNSDGNDSRTVTTDIMEDQVPGHENNDLRHSIGTSEQLPARCLSDGKDFVEAIFIAVSDRESEASTSSPVAESALMDRSRKPVCCGMTFHTDSALNEHYSLNHPTPLLRHSQATTDETMLAARRPRSRLQREGNNHLVAPYGRNEVS